MAKSDLHIVLAYSCVPVPSLSFPHKPRATEVVLQDAGAFLKADTNLDTDIPQGNVLSHKGSSKEPRILKIFIFRFM